MAELGPADDRGDPELALAGERLRIDRKPGLALRAQGVEGVQVLVQEDGLALGRSELAERVHRRVQEPALERASRPLPFLRKRGDPPGRFVSEGQERLASGLPEPRQEVGEDVERRLEPDLGECGPRASALEQERVPLSVVVEQTNGAVAVPDAERLGLVLALASRELDLEDDVPGRNRERGERVRVRIFELERPLLGAFLEQTRKPREPVTPVGELREPA